MRGEVLKPDDPYGAGVILGEDGRRYYFTAARVHKGEALKAGSRVDFIGLGEDARDIYPLGPPGASVSSPAPASVLSAPINFAPVGPAKGDGMFKYYFRAVTRNYFKFTGRARRAEYFSFLFITLVLLVVLTIADVMLSEAFVGADNYNSEEYIPITSGLLYIYSLIPSMSVTVRRLHDQGMSGWMLLMNFVPYLGGVILFILMFFDSHRNPNKHGPSPKYGGDETADVFA
ncbi:DUF805 domain-containing protein [Hyphomonas sp.]|uniref:DUF805 domain-containing protein n=1 Tax=Hyphomonas sp. TaxID=87 RepID=UPI0025BF07AB|nr:DUF805 domain-containing protein [Hyphomonas sp.]MBI1398988.1 DUF805 domain-containing protein [Hyphomonas sp.]